VRGGTLSEWTLDPGEYGLSGGTSDALAGADPAGNARMIELVLGGEAPLAARNAVVLNAAAAIYVGGVATDFGEAAGMAARALDSGAAAAVLARLR
jgi:anthranilate phosphoribosyltransferase